MANAAGVGSSYVTITSYKAGSLLLGTSVVQDPANYWSSNATNIKARFLGLSGFVVSGFLVSSGSAFRVEGASVVQDPANYWSSKATNIKAGF